METDYRPTVLVTSEPISSLCLPETRSLCPHLLLPGLTMKHAAIAGKQTLPLMSDSRNRMFSNHWSSSRYRHCHLALISLCTSCHKPPPDHLLQSHLEYLRSFPCQQTSLHQSDLPRIYGVLTYPVTLLGFLNSLSTPACLPCPHLQL